MMAQCSAHTDVSRSCLGSRAIAYQARGPGVMRLGAVVVTSMLCHSTVLFNARVREMPPGVMKRWSVSVGEQMRKWLWMWT